MNETLPCYIDRWWVLNTTTRWGRTGVSSYVLQYGLVYTFFIYFFTREAQTQVFGKLR